MTWLPFYVTFFFLIIDDLYMRGLKTFQTLSIYSPGPKKGGIVFGVFYDKSLIDKYLL